MQRRAMASVEATLEYLVYRSLAISFVVGLLALALLLVRAWFGVGLWRERERGRGVVVRV